MRDPDLVIAVGRITRSKNPDVIIETFLQLPTNYRLLFCGAPATDEDRALHARLLRDYDHGRIAYRSVPHDELRDVYRKAALMLHAGTTGLDKVVLEAMACECLVLSCSPDFEGVLPAECWCEPPRALA